MPPLLTYTPPNADSFLPQTSMTNDKSAFSLSGREGAAGTLPDEIYESTLSWWRAAVRRSLVGRLDAESHWIAALQVRDAVQNLRSTQLFVE